MKKLNFFFALIALGMTLTLASCTQKEGCTDSNAENYDRDAEKDCCCKYKGSVVFWYDQATSNKLITDGKTSLSFYVDDKLVGGHATNVYWTTGPECGTALSMTVDRDLGDLSSQVYEFTVYDNLGNLIWHNFQTWTANSCFKLQLTY